MSPAFGCTVFVYPRTVFVYPVKHNQCHALFVSQWIQGKGVASGYSGYWPAVIVLKRGSVTALKSLLGGFQ